MWLRSRGPAALAVLVLVLPVLVVVVAWEFLAGWFVDRFGGD
ncbi:MAG: hypothetical protein ACREIV_17220 [Planctomycetaceae bacterium]